MKKLLLSLLFLLYSSLGFSQFFESFENTTGITGPLPATWTLSSGNWAVFEKNTPATVGTNQSWGINAFATGIFYDGTQVASVSREQIGMGATSEDYLATPLITIPANGSFQLHFFSRTFTSGDQGTLFRVMAAPASASQTDPNSYVTLQQWNETGLNPNPGFEEKIVDIPAFYAGQSVYIAFVKVYTQPTASLDGDRWIIDAVSLVPSNACVLNAFASATSATTVDLTWNTTSQVPVEVMILPCSEPFPAPTDTGIVVSDNIYHFTNLIPNTCYRAYLKSSCPGSNSWQMITISYNYAAIRLISFLDSNSNGIMDTGEDYFQGGNFTITGNTTGYHNIVTAAVSGIYNFIPNYIPNDTFDLGFQIDSFHSSCFSLGTFNNDNIAPSQQTQTYYFPVIPIPSCFDNKVVLSQWSWPRPGTIDYDYLSIMTNSVNAPTNGTLTYTKAPNTTINSVTPSAGIVFTPTGFTYNYSGLTTTNSLNFTIRTNIPAIPSVNLGDNLMSSASISFSPSDIDSSNNVSSISQFVVGSYDPNDINESHGPQIQFDQFGQNDYLYYTIRFQNTGNANAIKVRVDDILDPRIDETTISMVAARHDYILFKTGSTLSWEFNNIQLPPASVNEDLSNGFITFRVKLKPGFAIGDIIPNTASIYFDSNPAIVTNTFNTEFVETLGTNDFNSGNFSIYPNPAKSSIQIVQNGNENVSQIVFCDITGKVVKRISNPLNTPSGIDISTLAKGIYFIEITTANNSKTVKKLIVQ